MKNFKKLKVSLFVAALALFSFTAVNQFVYNVDTAHSRIGFTITHLGIADFNGQFDKYETKITGKHADFSDAVFEFSADAASINTFNSNRDEHLRSGDFFDTDKFPKLNFKSTSVVSMRDNKFEIIGDLTMHGITKSVVLKAIHVGNFENPKSKKISSGFKITGTVNRSEFGVGPGFTAPMLSDEVQLIADVEFIRE